MKSLDQFLRFTITMTWSTLWIIVHSLPWKWVSLLKTQWFVSGLTWMQEMLNASQYWWTNQSSVRFEIYSLNFAIYTEASFVINLFIGLIILYFWFSVIIITFVLLCFWYSYEHVNLVHKMQEVHMTHYSHITLVAATTMWKGSTPLKGRSLPHQRWSSLC